jgi:hypothetical protein
MSSINNSISYNNTIYPYCFKIKDGCLPCPVNHLNKCLLILSRLICAKNLNNTNLVDQFDDELFYCLKEYGDIYKKLEIKLHVVVDKDKKIVYFPDNQRIQANLNLYLKDIYKNDANKKLSEEEENKVKDKFMLYSVLLTKKIKEKYDEYYQSQGFAEHDSLQPKEYGVVTLLGKEIKTPGGKKNNKTKRKKNNKTKRKKK